MKPKSSLIAAQTALALIASITLSSAATYIYEPFDVTAPGDGLAGKTTGSGLDANWVNYDSGTIQVGSGSLSYGDLATGAGNHLKLSDSTDGRGGVYAGVSSVPLTDGSVVWFSFLHANTLNNGNNRTVFTLGTDTINTGGNSIANSGSAFGVEFNNTNMSVLKYEGGTRTISTAAGTTALSTSLVLGRIAWGAGATDKIDLWLPGTDLSFTEATPATSLTATLNQSLFNKLVIGGKFNAPNIDEIRFASTSTEALGIAAVPEPSAALLGAIGSLLLLRRRR